MMIPFKQRLIRFICVQLVVAYGVYLGLALGWSTKGIILAIVVFEAIFMSIVFQP